MIASLVSSTLHEDKDTPSWHHSAESSADAQYSMCTNGDSSQKAILNFKVIWRLLMR